VTPIRLGAADFILKPFERDQLLFVVRSFAPSDCARVLGGALGLRTRLRSVARERTGARSLSG